jgi:hypothetical protein
MAALVREQLRRLGHEPPEEKKDFTEWQYYLARKNAERKAQKGARYPLRTWETEEEDVESEPEYDRIEEPGPVLSRSDKVDLRGRSSLKRERDFELFQKICPQTAEAMLGLEAEAAGEKQAKVRGDARRAAVASELKWLASRPPEVQIELGHDPAEVQKKLEKEEKKEKDLSEPAPPELSALQKLIGSGWSLVRSEPVAAAPITPVARA